jgi:hypothetical protein
MPGSALRDLRGDFLRYRGVVPLELTGDVLLAQEEIEFSVHASDRSPMFTNFIVESVQDVIKYSSFGQNPANKIGTPNN